MQAGRNNRTGVLIPAGTPLNTLGVVQCFGRRGIPVVYLDSGGRSAARYSRYISRHLRCPGPGQSDAEFVDTLLEFGGRLSDRMVLLPISDDCVLAISRHRQQLERFYHVPVPHYDIARTLVDKSQFYRLLEEMRIPYPLTQFPGDLDELRSMGQETAYPYIIKPAESLPFQAVFNRKCFVIDTPRRLERALRRLEGKNLGLMLQEIIPGRDIYCSSAYFDRDSQPLAACGWDKLRQYPPACGNGSLCRSRWMPSAVEPVLRFLTAINYSGIAGWELKRDPRDGQYKLLDVNARPMLQNRLPSACGVDIEYIAYLDATGQPVEREPAPTEGVMWVDDLADLASCLIYLRRGELDAGLVSAALRARRVHAVSLRDDPAVFCFHLLRQGLRALRLLLRTAVGRLPSR